MSMCVCVQMYTERKGFYSNIRCKVLRLFNFLECRHHSMCVGFCFCMRLKIRHEPTCCTFREQPEWHKSSHRINDGFRVGGLGLGTMQSSMANPKCHRGTDADATAAIAPARKSFHLKLRV